MKPTQFERLVITALQLILARLARPVGDTRNSKPEFNSVEQAWWDYTWKWMDGE